MLDQKKPIISLLFLFISKQRSKRKITCRCILDYEDLKFALKKLYKKCTFSFTVGVEICEKKKCVWFLLFYGRFVLLSQENHDIEDTKVIYWIIKPYILSEYFFNLLGEKLTVKSEKQDERHVLCDNVNIMNQKVNRMLKWSHVHARYIYEKKC